MTIHTFLLEGMGFDEDLLILQSIGLRAIFSGPVSLCDPSIQPIHGSFVVEMTF
jgi:hypothetical protein